MYINEKIYTESTERKVVQVGYNLKKEKNDRNRRGLISHECKQCRSSHNQGNAR